MKKTKNKRREEAGDQEETEEEEKWAHMDLAEFLDEVADAPEMDIGLQVLLDTSDIISSDKSTEEQSHAMAEASALHWT